MKISPKQKKWIKRIGILLLLRFLIGGLIYYAIVYRFKDVVQVALNIETKGAYDFDAGDIDVELFKGNLSMKNARLKFRDSTRHITHHDISIPNMELSIRSFKDLILHGKVYVRNLKIVQPSFSTTAYTKHEDKHIGLQARSIINGLQKATEHLNIENFELVNGKFSYDAEGSGKPFIGSRIKVLLAGFSERNLSERKMLGTDDLNISLSDQDWILPGGRHEISFSSLHFSAKRQHFDVDSFRMLVRGDDSSKLVFSADKFMLNSNDLMNSLEDNEIGFDSLICVRPVLDISSFHSNRPKKKRVDSAQAFFDKFNIAFVNISDGQIQYNNAKGQPMMSLKTNLKIYNLGIEPSGEKNFTSDSIDLNLKGIEFYSKDSLFRLAVGSCVFNGNKLIFNDVSYQPTDLNRSFKGMVYNSPKLILHDVSLDHLIHRQLNAFKAEIFQPVISLHRGKKTKKNRVDTSRNARRVDIFSSLHKLMQVNEFIIYDGSLTVETEGTKTRMVDIAGINGKILLNDFLESGNRQQMKTAIDLLSTGAIKINLPDVSLFMKEYRLLGSEQKNYSPFILIELKNGSVIKGEELTWEQLDWDQLIEDKKIDALLLHIGKLNVALNGKSQHSQNNSKKAPLHLNIGKLLIDEIAVKSSNNSNENNLSLTANDFKVTKLLTQNNHLTWEGINAQVSNLLFNNADQQINVNQINVGLPFFELNGITVKNRNPTLALDITVPKIKINYPVYTSRPESIKIKSLEVSGPEIDLNQLAVASSQTIKKANGPSVDLETFRISNGKLNWSDQRKNDSTELQLRIDSEIKNLHIPANKSNGISLDQMVVNASDASFRNNIINAVMPALALSINDGEFNFSDKTKHLVKGDFSAHWQNARTSVTTKKNVHFGVASISGQFNEKNFILQRGEKLSYTELIRSLSVEAGNIQYKNGKSEVIAGNISWNQKSNKVLQINKYEIINSMDWEEFQKKSEWQSDYITLKGETISIAGPDIKLNQGDTSFRIKKVSVSGIEMTITKDKRKPFRHGIEKPMPTMLISQLRWPVKIDTVSVMQSDIIVKQISEKTNREGVIPIRNIEVTVTGITNEKNPENYLAINARARLLDDNIREVVYKERYVPNADFEMKTFVSTLRLPQFSPITSPLAAVAVDKGFADTMYAEWKGNKYAAYGKMNFHYNNLKVRLVNKKDPEKNSFLLRLENMLANGLILNKNNKSASTIYMTRDEEKFFITYWVKSIMSGVLTTAGLKKSKKYKKSFLKNKHNWELEYIDVK